MKRIINNKKYDTETARMIGSDSYSNPRDFNYWAETLYRKRTGEYFLYGEGGPNSRYSKRIEQNCWSGGEKIIPLTYENARKWAEEHLSVNEYEAEFGEVSEDDSSETINVSMPAALLAKLRRQAQENETSVSKIITALIERAMNDN